MHTYRGFDRSLHGFSEESIPPYRLRQPGGKGMDSASVLSLHDTVDRAAFPFRWRIQLPGKGQGVLIPKPSPEY
jgi:hypothetical protein